MFFYVRDVKYIYDVLNYYLLLCSSASSIGGLCVEDEIGAVELKAV